MRHWKQRMSGILLLGAIGVSGCGLAEGVSYIPNFDRNQVPSVTTAANRIQTADTLAGAAEYLCIPNRASVRENTTDPVVLLYRVDEPFVLCEADSLKRIYPASVTKLLTAYVAIKYGNPDDTVRISYKASHLNINGAMVCGFYEGDTLSLKDLLTAMLLFSGNDAAIAVAEHISGSTAAFSELMNQEIQRLGGMHSNFVNPHGLHDPNHYTTAYDMYLVLNEMLQNEDILSILRQASCTIYYKDASGVQKSKVFQNTNCFLTKERELPDGIAILGGKTGTTTAAGCCLVQAFVTKNGKRYIAEVFGAKDYDLLYEKMTELLKQALEDDSI